MNQADRDTIIANSTERLERKGQLLAQPGDTAQPGYELSPELGIILAARSHPAYAILAQVQGRPVLELSVFGLADGDERPSLAVFEFLVKVPSQGFPRAFVPLATVYEYRLVPTDRAASLLANWAIRPAVGNGREVARVLTRYQPSDDQHRIDSRISVRGDGTTAHVAGLDPVHPKAEWACDQDELETVVADLLAGPTEPARLRYPGECPGDGVEEVEEPGCSCRASGPARKQ